MSIKVSNNFSYYVKLLPNIKSDFSHSDHASHHFTPSINSLCFTYHDLHLAIYNPSASSYITKACGSQLSAPCWYLILVRYSTGCHDNFLIAYIFYHHANSNHPSLEIVYQSVSIILWLLWTTWKSSRQTTF